MKTSEEKQKPILVENPETGQYFNMAPLIYYSNESAFGDMSDIAHELDSVIRQISVYTDYEKVVYCDHVTSVVFLFNLRDIFRQMTPIDNRNVLKNMQK